MVCRQQNVFLQSLSTNYINSIEYREVFCQGVGNIQTRSTKSSDPVPACIFFPQIRFEIDKKESRRYSSIISMDNIVCRQTCQSTEMTKEIASPSFSKPSNEDLYGTIFHEY